MGFHAEEEAALSLVSTSNLCEVIKFCMSHLYEMLVVIKVSGEIEWLIAYAYGHLYLNSDPAGFRQWSLC